MARGIYHATMINTVSPTYAREIMTPEGGRLDGLLRYRHFDVHGILNGLDYDTWNPATDRTWPPPSMPSTSPARKPEQAALQERLGLRGVGRAAGVDGHAARRAEGARHHRSRRAPAAQRDRRRRAVHRAGIGRRRFESMFRQLAGYHTTKMAAILATTPRSRRWSTPAAICSSCRRASSPAASAR